MTGEPTRAFDDHAHAPAHATCAAIGLTISPTGEGTAADAEAFTREVDAYLQNFVAPIFDGDRGQRCFHCGEFLTGLTAAIMGGGFQWGLAHGEGFCGKCHWPARGHHFMRRADGSELCTLRHYVLSYHPSVIEKPA